MTGAAAGPVPDDGVVVGQDHRGVWAWVAVQIDAAADLPESREYAELSEAGRLAKASADEATWISGQWDTDYTPHIALRFIGASSSGTTCVLLGRVYGADPADTANAALRLRRRLAGLPKHVFGHEVVDSAAVRGWLEPFAPHPQGIVEVRRRIRAERPLRPDARVGFYLTVDPFTGAPADSREPLWRALAGQREPVLLDLAFEPCVVPAELTGFLRLLVANYSQLAQPGTYMHPATMAVVRLDPDPFAVTAAPLFAAAAAKYASRAFRMRLTLASPAPLPDALARQLGEQIVGPEHTLVRPLLQEAGLAWGNVTSLDLLRWDAQYAGPMPVALPPNLRLLAELVDADEAAAALRLPVAVHGHVPGFAVRTPTIERTAQERDPAGRPDRPWIRLGVQEADGRVDPVGIAVAGLARHTLITGTAGSGKTATVQAVCERLWTEHKIPFLVLEPAGLGRGGYRSLAGRPGLESLTVFTAGSERVAPLRLNPFEVPDGFPVADHISGLLAAFDAAFGLWDPLPDLYDRALRLTYARRGIVPDEVAAGRPRAGWPTLRDFAAALADLVDEPGDTGAARTGAARTETADATRARMRSLLRGPCASTLDCAASYPLGDLLARPAVVELAGVGANPGEQALVAALILQMVGEGVRTRESREGAGAAGGAAIEGLAHVVVVEDAHLLLGLPGPGDASRQSTAKARAARLMARSLQENHRFGAGLILVESVPSRLVEDAYKGSNLKIMHRLPAQDDRGLMAATLRLSPDQERYAAALETSAAFVHHDGLDRAALIRADGPTHSSEPVGDVDIERRFRRLADEVPGVDAALAPFPECLGCRHRCRFRNRAATVVRPEDVAALQDAARTLPKPSAARTAWWDDMAERVRAISELAPLDPAPDEPTRRDYEACVFRLMAMEAWPGAALPWNREYRAHSSASLEAPPQGTAPGG